MSASTELEALAELDETENSPQAMKSLIDDVDEQIKANLISQFGLSQMLGEFKDGGGVDTIHNVRNDVYSSKDVKAEVTEQASGYNKKIARTYHGQSKSYQEINRMQSELKKSGNLVDVNTGKLLRRNQKTDLDHTISTKEIYEDKGRILAGEGVDKLANNETNLHLTDASINRSMGAANKTQYANSLDEKKANWQAEKAKILENKNLTSEKRTAKLQNNENKMQANKQAIKENDQVARKSYNTSVNKYYKSPKFLKSTLKNSAGQGLKNAKAQIIGAIMVQIEGALFRVVKHVIAVWKSFKTMRERFTDFIDKAKTELKQITERVGQIKDAALSGLTGGFIGAIINTIINIFVTTSGNFACILSSAFTSLVQAVKILFDKTVPFATRLAQALKLISTAVMASLSVMLSEVLSKAIATHAPFLAPISDAIATGISAIVMGVLTAFIIYSIDNFKKVVTKVKEQFQTLMVGLTVSKQTILDNYNRAITHIDEMYQEVLQNIYQHYAETERLQKLAYDLELPTADQFVASIDLARETGVSEEKILKNKSDIENYFNS